MDTTKRIYSTNGFASQLPVFEEKVNQLFLIMVGSGLDPSDATLFIMEAAHSARLEYTLSRSMVKPANRLDQLCRCGHALRHHEPEAGDPDNSCEECACQRWNP